MLYACHIDTNERVRASKGVTAYCPQCKEILITKCGDINTDHFAHNAGSSCIFSKYDKEITNYQAGETPWHKRWKSRRLSYSSGETIEVPILKNNTLKIADVVTPSGLVIEFQRSPMLLKERRFREKHYENMIWVIHRNLRSSKTWMEDTGIPIVIDTNIFDSFIDREEPLRGYHNKNIKISPLKFKQEVMNGMVTNIRDIGE